jgi:hypothetical protein
MVCASSTTPIWHPTIKDTYSKLVPAPITVKPSEQGYTSGFLGAREVATQEQWVRLFYARYFDVTPTELEITFGTSPLPSVGTEQHKTIRKSLNQIWKGLRSRAFGAESPLSLFVQHKVEEFDFLSTLTRLFRMEILFNRIPVGGEAPRAQQLRLGLATRYADVRDEHVRRADHSMAGAVANATRDLNVARLGAHSTMKSSRVREARNVLEFREQEESKWKSQLAGLRGNTEPTARGPIGKRYAYLTNDCQQTFWEKIWCKDVAVALLSGLKNVIDIPATLEHSDALYQAVFMAYAMDVWQYCIGVEYESHFATDALKAAGVQGGVIEMAGESLRPQVYANMSGAGRSLFEDAPGKELDRLRVSIVEPDSPTEGSSKRKLDVEPTFIHKFDFLAKKRRT